MDTEPYRTLQRHLIAHEKELLELHRALVRFPTVNKGDGQSAHEAELASFAAEYLQDAGISARILEGAPERANLLAEIGSGERSMLWMSHSDVVPAGDESEWTHPPFAAVLDQGRIWGRGAHDCKMLVAAQLFVLAQCARLGLPVDGRLKLAVGADEEAGGHWGFGWLAREHSEFLRADMAICEGGGDTIGCFDGHTPEISLGAGEKGRYEVTFHLRGPGGHASTPWGHLNPLSELSRIAEQLERVQPALHWDSPIFEHLGRWTGMGPPRNPRQLEAAIDMVADRSDGLARSLRGQSRMTFTPTVFRSGETSNSIPGEARLSCDVRLLPGQDRADIDAVVAEVLKGSANVTVEVDVTSPPSVSSAPAEVQELFRKSIEQAIGVTARIVPTWCVGATDARYVRSVGTPVYGFQFISPDADPTRLGIHCVDESIEAGILLPCALSLARLAANFFASSD